MSTTWTNENKRVVKVGVLYDAPKIYDAVATYGGLAQATPWTLETKSS